ncbi:hypothetical protein FO519_004249 [Halicephalobus sp. NKZ332]|nr:hypothetical protein FO519_004249 [Halicephalobus sp. NKZ332]
MAGIYLPLTKFILLANQITVNLTKENSEAAVFNNFEENAVYNDMPADFAYDNNLKPPDAVYIEEDERHWRNRPFDTGGRDYGILRDSSDYATDITKSLRKVPEGKSGRGKVVQFLFRINGHCLFLDLFLDGQFSQALTKLSGDFDFASQRVIITAFCALYLNSIARHAMPIDRTNFFSFTFLLILVLNGKKAISTRPVIHETYQISRVSPAIHRPVPPQHSKNLSGPHQDAHQDTHRNLHQGFHQALHQRSKFIDINKDEMKEDEIFDKMEFVRNSGKRRDELYKYEKRTYGTMPRQFECYSCMSLTYQENWEHLQFMYTTPKVFTNRCNDPFMQRNIPTVLCGSFCASLLEPNLEGGIFLGYKYIRGCVDRILRHGFNQSALRTHRFNQVDQCRSLPRAQLFNPPKGVEMPFFGDVQLCSCYGDKCNGASSASSRNFTASVFLFLFLNICLSLLQFLLPGFDFFLVHR